MKRILHWFASLPAKLGRFLQGEMAILLCLIHAICFLSAVAVMSPPNPEFGQFLDNLYRSGGWCSATMFAGRPFHFHYESWLLTFVFLIDLPALLVEFFISLAVMPFESWLPSLTTYTSSYISAGLMLAVSSLQWLAVGHGIQSHALKGGHPPRWLRFIRCHIVVIILLLVIVGLILIPCLNARSVALGGIRHGGMSFGY